MAYDPSQKITGLRPVSNQAGTSPQVNEYPVSASYATTIGEGCIVAYSQTGVIQVNSTVAALTTASIIGVAAQNLAATPGAGATIKVYDDPNQRYLLSADGAITAADRVESIGRYSNVVSNVYNATYGYGKTQMDASEITSVEDDGDLVQIVGFPTILGQTSGATNAQCEVKLSPRWLYLYSTIKTTHVT
jgi:hypothetical protein